jgi:predicted DNA-binding antitoxin AbrB/MazE fold protein
MARATGAKLDFRDINLNDGEIDRVSVRATFKKNKKKSEASGVKINSELLREVEEFINLEENKFKYANKRQFVDVAVSEYLRRHKRKR